MSTPYINIDSFGASFIRLYLTVPGNMLSSQATNGASKTKLEENKSMLYCGVNPVYQHHSYLPLTALHLLCLGAPKASEARTSHSKAAGLTAD